MTKLNKKKKAKTEVLWSNYLLALSIYILNIPYIVRGPKEFRGSLFQSSWGFNDLMKDWRIWACRLQLWLTSWLCVTEEAEHFNPTEKHVRRRRNESEAGLGTLSQPPLILPSVLTCGFGSVLIKLIILRRRRRVRTGREQTGIGECVGQVEERAKEAEARIGKVSLKRSH